MKKKILAMMLSLTMVLNTFSVAGATAVEFTDGEVAEAVELEEVVAEEQIPEEAELFDDEGVVVEDNDTAVAEDVGTTTTVKIGENVSAEITLVQVDEYNESNNVYEATISGTGATWDYYREGYDCVTGANLNPFYNRKFVKITIQSGITRIGNYLFYKSEAKEAIIPEGVESIGDFSFANGLWESITLPESMTELGKYVFANNPVLQNFIYHGTIEEVPEGAFYYDESLQSFDFDGVKEIGVYAFEGCSSLNSIILNDEISKIDEAAFAGCSNVMELRLPNAPLALFNTFCGCNKLINVTIPENIVNLNRTFYNCSYLQNVEIQGKKTRIDSNTFDRCPRMKTISCYDCSYAKRYEDYYKTIDFISLGESNHEWSEKKIIDIEPTCKEKGSKSYHCDICEVTDEPEEMPALGHNWNNGVIIQQPTYEEDGIREYTCYRCEEKKQEPISKLSVPSIEIVSSEWISHTVANIVCTPNVDGKLHYIWTEQGTAAPTFDPAAWINVSVYANNQTTFTVNVPSNTPIKIYYVLEGTDGKLSEQKSYSLDETTRPSLERTTYKVGNSIIATIEGDTLTLTGSGETYNHYDEIGWCERNIRYGIKKVTIDENITGIGQFFFTDFKSIKEIVFPEGFQSIGEWAFNECAQLETIQLPSTINEIGYAAFNGCALTSFDWPETVTVIPSYAFTGCSNLVEFSVPETVTDIEGHAFYGCDDLTKITIPKSVTHFGNDIFYDCRSLTIYGFRDSAAERYANNNDIPFVSADYKVVFKNNGRTVKTEYIIKGENATPPELKKEGYTLSWDADYTDIQEDMIINAVWTKDDDDSTEPPIIIYPPEETKYTVTFKDRGEVVKTEKVKSGEAADLPYLYRYGYKLTWDKDFSNVTSNMTVNAIWTIIEPEKVTNLTAEIIFNKISLSWDESEYAGYYKIYRKTSSDEKFALVARTSQTLWNDRRAKTGVEYQYKTVAVRSVGGEIYSSLESDVVTVKLGAPEVGRVYTVGNLNYKVMTTSEVRVTGAAKSVASLAIPSAVSICGKSFKVTSIDHKAFYENEDLISVRMGQYITYVGQYSFYRCPNLESVRFGRNVEVISTCAFRECPKLGNIVLPEKVRRLGAKVFYLCPSLKTLYIKTNNLEYIGKKGLAIDRSTVIKVPSSKYYVYKKMIEKSIKFSATKIVKM